MARPKGPEKVSVLIRVTRPTHEWLERKANGKAVPTYLAETFERQAAEAAKATVTYDSGGGKVIEVPTKHYERKTVNPNFKKAGRK